MLLLPLGCAGAALAFSHAGDAIRAMLPRLACLLRFRPIMMTTLCAIMGALPIALGLGAGAELRQPLGIAIVGGLLFSQLITLFITPVLYLCFDRLGRAPAPASAETAPSR